MTTTRNRRRTARTNPSLKFHQRLVLNQWLLDLFEVSRWEDLITDTMKKPDCEGCDENNVSHFYHELTRPLFDHPKLTNDQLLRYDENIFHHTSTINAHRPEPIRWKYFQYLALLFTEIYLDRYFDDAARLRDELNAHVKRFNDGEWPPPGNAIVAPLSTADQVDEFSPQDLRKLAFWMATGSGKTLLMHVNILQYKYYLKRHGRQGELNRTILLTPNEGLSRQHLAEFQAAGIEAELFSKDQGSLFRGHAIEIIDIHKLRDTMGQKTVAVDAFEGNNLVLVDEGHRGASGFEWKDRRDKLCATGFSFEYSATFGQAMKAANKPELTQEYCKSVLFDYSYRYFYRDGYGKDYRILNLADDHDEEINKLYLTACLIAFYQQLRLYHDKEREFRPFLLEKPLWVFVGHTVTRKKGEEQEITSDEATLTDAIVVLKFLAGFIGDHLDSKARLRRLLSGSTGLLDERGNDIFANAFPYLVKLNLTAERVFDDVLEHLFNAPSGGRFYVENLKGVDGEIALRVGDSERSFGLINVGDDTKLCKLCEAHEELHVREPEFSQSHFAEIANDDSPVNVLIGAKKFTEGWNSWRVSTMGLLNVGRNEGSEIIQLFGRGVRLRGHDNSLRRSTKLGSITPPDHVRVLETLNVFGIRAAYMQQFKAYLEDEGLPTEDERETIILPTLKSPNLPKLKIVDVKRGFDYKRDAPKPTLAEPPDNLLPVVVNWYPKLQARESTGAAVASTPAQMNEEKLTEKHLAFLNIDALYFDLQQYKNERGWHNLNIPKATIHGLLRRRDWYRLLIPEQEMQFDTYRKVNRWQEIASTLLRKYCDRYYNHHKGLNQPLEVRELSPDEPNCDVEYQLLVDKSLETVIAQLHQLRDAIGSGLLWDVSFTNPHAIVFDRHFYAPLMTIRNLGVEVSPVSLNQGESEFVRNLKEYPSKNPAFFADKDLYLLRNQSRGTGIGFAEAHSFYPDFILWLVIGERQFITFVDPKGLRNLEGLEDPKIRFRETVKDIERRIRIDDPTITLNSCIVAVTSPEQRPFWGQNRTQMEDRHVFFQDDLLYIPKLLRAALKP